MSLSRIRNRIEALQRKYALQLAVIRLHPYAIRFCDQWAVAKANHQPLPQPHPFIVELTDAGFRLPTFMALHKYIEKPYPRNYPTPCGILTALLPQAATRGIIDAVLRGHPPADSIPISAFGTDPPYPRTEPHPCLPFTLCLQSLDALTPHVQKYAPAHAT